MKGSDNSLIHHRTRGNSNPHVGHFYRKCPFLIATLHNDHFLVSQKMAMKMISDANVIRCGSLCATHLRWNLCPSWRRSTRRRSGRDGESRSGSSANQLSNCSGFCWPLALRGVDGCGLRRRQAHGQYCFVLATLNLAHFTCRRTSPSMNLRRQRCSTGW